MKAPGIVVMDINKSEQERDRMKLLEVVCSLLRVVIKNMTIELPRMATTPVEPKIIQNQTSSFFKPLAGEVCVALTDSFLVSIKLKICDHFSLILTTEKKLDRFFVARRFKIKRSLCVLVSNKPVITCTLMMHSTRTLMPNDSWLCIFISTPPRKSYTLRSYR